MVKGMQPHVDCRARSRQNYVPYISRESRLKSLRTRTSVAAPGRHLPQETLAEMIGTTRSRVSFFMNKFRKLGFIEYNGHLEVHSSLLNVVLHDQPQISGVQAGRREL